MTDFTTHLDDNEHAMSDQDVCIAVGEDLTQTYAGHPWMVGCDHEAGTVYIKLAYDPPAAKPQLGQMEYMLHLSTVLGPGGQKRVRTAGGEMLERWGLPRAAATTDSRDAAAAHGLDIG
jgi:hypothetical protein